MRPAALSLGATLALCWGVAAPLDSGLSALARDEQDGKPITSKCPCKPNQAVKADQTLNYEGQVIGFC